MVWDHCESLYDGYIPKRLWQVRYERLLCVDANTFVHHEREWSRGSLFFVRLLVRLCVQLSGSIECLNG